MRLSRVIAIAASIVLPATGLIAQGQPPPAPTETVTPAIPGVVAAGTKVEVIKAGFAAPKAPSHCPMAA